jgi:hypothetical protein
LAGLLLLSNILDSGALFASQPAQNPNDTTIPLGIALESFSYPYPVRFFEFEMQAQIVRMGYMDISPSIPASGETVVTARQEYRWLLSGKDH